MSSLKIRDQKADHLLTPENSAVIIIDYQATQVGSIESTDKYWMVQNTIALVEFGEEIWQKLHSLTSQLYIMRPNLDGRSPIFAISLILACRNRLLSFS